MNGLTSRQVNKKIEDRSTADPLIVRLPMILLQREAGFVPARSGGTNGPLTCRAF